MIKKKKTGRNPLMSGLLPFMLFIAGMVFGRIGLNANNIVLTEDEWTCSQFLNGECSTWKRKSKAQDDNK